MVQVKLKINAVDLSAFLLEPPMADWEIEHQAGGEIALAVFTIRDADNTITLVGGNEVVIENASDSTERFFGGLLTEVVQKTEGMGRLYECKALGWVFDLSRTVVNHIFTGKSDQYIITNTSEGIFLGTNAKTVLKDLSAYTVIVANVEEGIANTQLRVYNGETVRDIMDNFIAETGFIWGVEPDQTVYYRPMDAVANSQSLSDNPNDSSSFGYFGMTYMRNFSEIVNAVYVYGGWYIKENESRTYPANGTQTDFIVPHHWRFDQQTEALPVVETWNGSSFDIITVARVQDPDGDTFDVLWDELQRNFIFAVAPGNYTESWRVTSDLFEPARGEAKNNASILLNGQFELVIKDDTIRDDDRAESRAGAELLKRASEGVRIMCRTIQDGFKVGESIAFVNSIHGLNGNFLVSKMVMHGLGAAVTEYELTLNRIIVPA